MADPTLGERLESWRLAAGLSQIELADRVGVEQQTVSQWESNATKPLSRRASSIAKALGLSERDVLLAIGGRDPEAPDLADRVSDLERRVRALEAKDRPPRGRG